MRKLPKVSIIMATYNRANFIAETLNAIQKQTFQDWECLIIDDGGTDSTREVIAPFLETDNRFKFDLRTDNYLKGLPGCRNYGLDLAKGEFIIFFDDDDIPHPQNLEICVEELSKDDKIFFCRYGREVFFDDFNYKYVYSKNYKSVYVDATDTYKVLTNELQIISTSVMWRKECFIENRFKEHLMYAEDWELYSRIISSGFKGISIDKTLFYGRKHVLSNTGEFYSNNPVRRASNADAIILAVENLKEKKMLNYSITRFFIVTSYNYREFNLFLRIIKALDLSLLKAWQWRIFFLSLNVRLPINRLKVNILRNKLFQKNNF